MPRPSCPPGGLGGQSGLAFADRATRPFKGVLPSLGTHGDALGTDHRHVLQPHMSEDTGQIRDAVLESPGGTITRVQAATRCCDEDLLAGGEETFGAAFGVAKGFTGNNNADDPGL